VLAVSLLVLRILILAILFLVAGNLSILRRLRGSFQIWLLLFQAAQWTTAMILLYDHFLEKRWTAIDIFVLVLPLVSLAELVISDAIVPPHHLSISYNAVSTTAAFLCFFAAAAFRWPYSVFNSGSYSFELFRIGSRVLEISPRGMIVSATFTMCVYCIKILYLLWRSRNWSALTLIKASYEITQVSAGTLKSEDEIQENQVAAGKGSRKIHPSPQLIPSVRRDPQHQNSLDDTSVMPHTVDHPGVESPALTFPTAADSERNPIYPREATSRSHSSLMADEQETASVKGEGHSASKTSALKSPWAGCTSLVANDIGFSVLQRSHDQILYFLVPKRVGHRIFRFMKKYRLPIVIVSNLLMSIQVIVVILAMCGVYLPDHGAAMKFFIAANSIHSVYGFTVSLRAGILAKVVKSFDFWFLLICQVLESISMWYSVAGAAERPVLTVTAIIAIDVAGFFYCASDASITGKVSKIIGSALRVLAQSIGIACILLQYGAWEQADEESARQSLGWLANYWCAQPALLVFTGSIQTKHLFSLCCYSFRNPSSTLVSFAATMTCFYLNIAISNGFSKTNNSVVLECTFHRATTLSDSDNTHCETSHQEGD
jgi:hypothetical protein